MGAAAIRVEAENEFDDADVRPRRGKHYYRGFELPTLTPTEEEVKAMEAMIISAFETHGAELTFAELSELVDGFRDSSFRRLIRAETLYLRSETENILVWVGHTPVAGKAINRLVSQSRRLVPTLVSSKRYHKQARLDYPIIRRRSDALRIDLTSCHWAPMALRLSDAEQHRVKSTIAAHVDSYRELNLAYYRDTEWPVRVEKHDLRTSYDAALRDEAIYDAERGDEIGLSESELTFLRAYRLDVRRWEEQYTAQLEDADIAPEP